MERGMQGKKKEAKSPPERCVEQTGSRLSIKGRKDRDKRARRRREGRVWEPRQEDTKVCSEMGKNEFTQGWSGPCSLKQGCGDRSGLDPLLRRDPGDTGKNSFVSVSLELFPCVLSSPCEQGKKKKMSF